MWRWGLGPVFLYECLANSRRWQTYAIRSVGVAVLLGAIATIAVPRLSTDLTAANAWREYAALGESYFYAVIGVELTLVLLAAPAATAGAICVDRARGTLTHMLATDLSDPEIVLGKLAARLLPVFGLVACSWPVMGLSSLLGGIDPNSLAYAFAIILAVSVLGCTMAMALSVWARKPYEVVLAVYTVWIIVMLTWPIWFGISRSGLVGGPPGWTLVMNPYYLAFAPYTVPGRLVTADYLGFFGATLGASLVFALLSVWRMRPVARRGIDESRREPGLGVFGRLTRALPGPSLDRNPVLWREWHRSRPSRWMLLLVLLLGGGTSIACAYGIATIWAFGLKEQQSTPDPAVIMAAYSVMLQVLFGLIMLAAVAPMSMSEERQRGSLDLLAVTTLSTPSIVVGKWLAMLRPALLLAFWPGALALVWATAHKPPPMIPPNVPARYYEQLTRGEAWLGGALMAPTIVIHGALLASLGLAAAVWIARQGRAIGVSVGILVALAIGWPALLMAIRTTGPPAEGLMALSPFFSVVGVIELVDSRRVYNRSLLAWISFWDLECLVLALGLLWLVARSFDDRFGRIPERPRRVPLLSDVVVVLAAVLVVGGVFGAGAIWRLGLEYQRRVVELGGGACVLLSVAGLVLAASIAAWRMSGEPATGDRRAFAGRFWESFRLVLLLAIGPAIVALTMATAPASIKVQDKVTTDANGVTTRISTDGEGYTTIWRNDKTGKMLEYRDATEAEIAEAGVIRKERDRVALVSVAALTVVTILIHGAAFIALGAVLGRWIGRRKRAISAIVGLALLVMVGWPILLAWLGPHDDTGRSLFSASAIVAFGGLLIHLSDPDVLTEVAEWVSGWDAFWLLVGIVAAWLAFRGPGRRARAVAIEEATSEVDVGEPVAAAD